MKKYKIISLISLLLFPFISNIASNNKLIVNASSSFNYDDAFDTNPVSMSKASSIKDISGDGSKDHGAVPSSSWGDPVLISDNSYLIYTLGDESRLLNGLHIDITLKNWNQNNEIVAQENKINFYVSENIENFNNCIYSISARENIKFVEEIDLSNYVRSLKKAYLKIELVQSKVNCKNDNCKNGVHSCGTSETIATPDNYINLHYLGIKIFKIAINENEPLKDGKKPTPNDFKYHLPEEIYAMKEYVFPEIKFTDNVDENIDYYLTCQDPYNNTIDLGKNAKSFIPDYEGIYTFEIKASDMANNTYTDKFSLAAVIAPNMPIIYWNTIPEKNGRVGENYFIQPLSYPDGSKYELKTSVVDPEGNEVKINNHLFKPTIVGEHKIYYSATNEYGTSKLFSRVYVKYNTHGQDPYTLTKDMSHYKGAISMVDDNIVVSGNSYCMLPFSLEEGIQLNVELSTLKGAWLGINFTRYACFSQYYFDEQDYIKNSSAPGLYVLIYKDNDGMYYCNIDYKPLSGGRMVVANHSYAGGNNNNLTLSLRKKENTDNIVFIVNGQINKNYELNNSVLASTISDNEGFIYLGFSNIVSGPVSIKKIDICDTDAPEIIIDGTINNSYTLNSEFIIPSIKAIDAHDGKVNVKTNLYAPNGKEIDLNLEKVTFDVEGIYYLIVSCKDLSNNENNKIYEIKVGNTNKEIFFKKDKATKKGCKGSGSNVSTIIFLVSILTILIVGKNKYGKSN